MDLSNSTAFFAGQTTDDERMTALLEGAYDYWEPQRGEIVQGHVMRISPNEILVDIGAKAEGVVVGRELQHIEPDVLESLDVGSEVLAYVVTPEDKDGNILLSLSRAQLESDWRLAEARLEQEEVFEATVSAFNKGGLLVHMGKIRGFVPASQIDRSHWDGEASNRNLEERLAELVGHEMQLKVIELDRGRNRLIFSERAALSQYRQEQKVRLLAELEEGQIKRGVVTNLCDFGAFVDLGGVDGLVHLSELSWGRVSGPQDVLQVGQTVEVYVLSVDCERERIGLSLKRLQPEPWSQIDELYHVGQLVQGEVTNLAKFGAFVRLDGSEIEGLIHISEFSEEPVSHPDEVVQKGDRVTVEIIRIESDRRRIGLSMKTTHSPQQGATEDEPEGGGELI
jgi:small subunit ribosomal protein S1